MALFGIAIDTSGDVDLGGTGVTTLPDSLEVGGQVIGIDYLSFLIPDAFPKLQEAQDKTGLDLSDVFNEALTLYILAVQRKAEGKLGVGFLDEANNTFSEIKTDGLSNVQPNSVGQPTSTPQP